MYIETLENIGLTPNEAKIYRTLLDLKKASIWDIASHAEIHRRNAYDAIQRLIHKGLAVQILPKKVLTYAPVHPNKLKELLQEKEDMLGATLPGLIKKFDENLAAQSFYVYKGIGGFKNYVDLEIEVGKDIYGMGSKGSWFDPRIKNFMTRSVKKYATLKIKNRIIYDAEIANHPDVPDRVGGEYKFLPKGFSTHSSLDIFGDYVAIYSGVEIKKFSDDVSIFILKDKTLASDFLKWWELIWAGLAKPKKV
jgi:predicted transcriptional regulator